MITYKSVSRILTDKGLADGRGQRGHEEEDGHDERAHVLGSLCERVLKSSDGCENLADGDEDVRSRLNPHVERRNTTAVAGGVFTTWIGLVKSEGM